MHSDSSPARWPWRRCLMDYLQARIIITIIKRVLGWFGSELVFDRNQRMRQCFCSFLRRKRSPIFDIHVKGTDDRSLAMRMIANLTPSFIICMWTSFLPAAVQLWQSATLCRRSSRRTFSNMFLCFGQGSSHYMTQHPTWNLGLLALGSCTRSLRLVRCSSVIFRHSKCFPWLQRPIPLRSNDPTRTIECCWDCTVKALCTLSRGKALLTQLE